jgi:ribosomal protein S18 acetylase RimI-like enzyme
MGRFAEFLPKDVGQLPLDISDGLTIRAAGFGDHAVLAGIAAEREGTTPEFQLKLFERQIANQSESQSMILVAEVTGEVIGFGKCAYCKVQDGGPVNSAPEGWYLTGVIVTPKFRRRKIGHQLTQSRLEWIAQRASKAYYFASAQNRASIELHRHFGFVELTRDFYFPNTTFMGGVGILFEIDLAHK